MIKSFRSFPVFFLFHFLQKNQKKKEKNKQKQEEKKNLGSANNNLATSKSFEEERFNNKAFSFFDGSMSGSKIIN